MPTNVGDIIRVVARMSWGEDEIQNVYHLRVTSGDDEANADVLDDIAECLDDAYAFLDDYIAAEVSFDSIEAYNLTEDEYLGIAEWPTLTDGAATNDPLPPQTAALALFSTATPRSQGRKFLPVMTIGSLDDTGTLENDTLSAIEQYILTLLAGVVGTYIEAEFGNWNEALARFADWLFGEARDLFATQRRRYIGRGA